MSRRRIWIARGIAMAADFVQIVLLPVFGLGSVFMPNAVMDVIVAIVLILLVGWHIAFLPTFLIEQLPFADLAPTWTVAVFIVTRQKRGEEPKLEAKSE